MNARHNESPPDRVPVFETYLEAHREATRRSSMDAENGIVSRVVKSPYGGFVIRSWPVELFLEPEMRGIVSGGKSFY